MTLKYIILSTVLLLMYTNNKVFSQNIYSEIDKQSISTSRQIQSHKDLALYLTKNIKNEKDKIRALYIWISHNIKYDFKNRNTRRTYPSSHNFADEALRKRTGVCHHYSSLFKAMAEDIGLEAYIISGIARNNGDKISSLSHSWNAVKVKDKFLFLDVTWASGYMMNNKYVHQFRDIHFLSSPELFIKKHYPYDPIWQFNNNPITSINFMNKDFLSKPIFFNLTDSLKLYILQDNLDKLIFSNKRIRLFGNNNQNITNELKQNDAKITNIKYNKSIDKLNAGIKKYNRYISLKNNLFNNFSIADSVILTLICKARKDIDSSSEGLESISTENINFLSIVENTKKQIPSLKTDIYNEFIFVEKYIKTDKNHRRELFYIRKR